MRKYIITVNGNRREKVSMIRFVRSFGTGLKEAKDFVEESIQFDSWMDDSVTFNMCVTDEQMGRHYVWTRTNESSSRIIECEVWKFPAVDIDISHRETVR